MASWQIVNNELIPMDCSEPAHFVNPTPIGWGVIDNTLTPTGYAKPKGFVNPTPIGWGVIDNTLTPTGYAKPKGFVNPTPISMWSVQNGVLTNGAEPPKWGAFINSNLSRVTIPNSVKEIGEFTFYNTKLKTVTISKDCKYYPTSFPEDCEVNFYN